MSFITCKRHSLYKSWWKSFGRVSFSCYKVGNNCKELIYRANKWVVFIIVQNTRNINYHGGNGLYLDSWKLRNLREKLLDIKPIPLPFQFIPFPPLCLLWDLKDCLALLRLAISSNTCFNNFSTIPHLIELKVSKSLDIARVPATQQCLTLKIKRRGRN